MVHSCRNMFRGGGVVHQCRKMLRGDGVVHLADKCLGVVVWCTHVNKCLVEVV